MLSIRLRAYAPAKRRLRAYEVTLCPDLFGAWVVEKTYGRIGKVGRAKIRSFASWEDARADLRACLNRRASAPRRIGVAYEVLGVRGLPNLQPSDLQDLLRTLPTCPPGSDLPQEAELHCGCGQNRPDFA
jgi:predicted DNA-binding WGR domain protein